jgi:integrase
MRAYAAAMSGEALEIGAKKTLPGSISALTVAFYNSQAFHSLAASTKKTYRDIAERFRSDNGDRSVSGLTPAKIREMVNNRKNKPGAAVNFLKVLRLMMEMAVEQGLRPDNPCYGIKIKKSREEKGKYKIGFREWGEAEIEKFEAKHAIGTRARLAFALLLYTGQRRSDVIRMGRQHEKNGMLTVKQQKTGVELSIPIDSELRKIIDATTTGNMTYLLTQYDQPFTAPGFTNWFREVCEEARIFGFSPHGLRKSACRRLANAGCSAHEIMAISGHQTLKEVEQYTRGFDQKRLADSAMRKVKGGIN